MNRLTWARAPASYQFAPESLVGFAPASAQEPLTWFFAFDGGRVEGVDLETGQTFFAAQTPLPLGPGAGATLAASDDGRWLAVAESAGTRAVLYDVPRGALVRTFERKDYHADVSGFALAFARHDGRDVLLVARAWNELDAWSLPELERLIPEDPDAHLEFFFGPLAVSPSGRWVSSAGWVWHPVGMQRVFDLQQWLTARTADPPELPTSLCAEWWNDEACWVTDGLLALAGCPQEGNDLFFSEITGTQLVALPSGQATHFLPGVPSLIASDGVHLFVGEPSAPTPRTCVYDPVSGALLLTIPHLMHAFHRPSRTLLHFPTAGGVELFWLRGALPQVTDALPPGPSEAALLVLADALEAQGAPAEAIAHCRGPGPHSPRCWVLEALR